MEAYHNLDEMKPWNDRLQILQVVGIVDEATDVKTFTFRSDAQTWFKYKPGQFITLEIPVGNEPLLRTYTLSSTPSRPFSISITIKAQKDSIGTRWMFENLKIGDFIKAFGPAGHFTHFLYPASKYLFISAGTGVTPMMSMARWFADCAPRTDINFINCARTPEELLFSQELDFLWRHMPSLSLSFLVQNRSQQRSWAGHIGKIDEQRLPLLCPDFKDREVFCCGPEAFMALIGKILSNAGFDMAHYHQESFDTTPADAPEQPVAALSASDQAADGGEDLLSVRFSVSGKEGSCLKSQTLLQAARAAGVRIPAACENGLCGTCKSMKISGEVVMEHNGGILDEEIEEGYILPCCSKPLTAVEIEA